jgi:predicted nuclease with TOPRIM domain
MKLAQLYEAKIKNDTNHLTQLISYNSIKSRLDETNERNTEIEAEMKKLKGDLKESSKEYATIKPQIDLLKSELDYNKNVIIANCNNQIMMSKGDIDKVIYENQEIERMIKREKHRN